MSPDVSFDHVVRSVCILIYSCVAANSQHEPVIQIQTFIQSTGWPLSVMIMTNGPMAGQTGSNGINKSRCRHYLKLETSEQTSLSFSILICQIHCPIQINYRLRLNVLKKSMQLTLINCCVRADLIIPLGGGSAGSFRNYPLITAIKNKKTSDKCRDGRPAFGLSLAGN